MRKSLRNLVCQVVAHSFILTGVVRYATRKALNSKCILSLYFHKPSKAEFEWCIQWLKKNGFRFISLDDVERVKNGEIPFPKGSVLLTVDDGWRSNVPNVVEVAIRHEVPVTIFVSTSPVEEGAYWWSYVHQAKQKGLIPYTKYELKKMPEQTRVGILQEIKKKVNPGRDAMTVDEVKTISAYPYITIGAHTHTHPILINCNQKQIYEELKISRQKLESWIGKEVDYFAYPNGDYSTREAQILKNLKYRLAFSSDPKYLTPESLRNSFTLPRFGFLEGASTAENICRMIGIWQPLMMKLSRFPYLKPKKNNKEIIQESMPKGGPSPA
ncbi:polysaccharide deacetylase family protein [Longitalea arenae]|uniref:polysaccharide deacetylase family protein n=1 Tax=Longitalea arenae TaxID=2812558 RepID=UPI001967613E|nr:polysaccharide deacetylase family protein [Longitalea arenae]